MATRTRYLAQLFEGPEPGGVELDGATAYAMNSGIRAAEGLVRRLARGEGFRYDGEAPERDGDVYTRRWTSAMGRVVVVRVRPAHPVHDGV